jgi:hypothetical protein
MVVSGQQMKPPNMAATFVVALALVATVARASPSAMSNDAEAYRAQYGSPLASRDNSAPIYGDAALAKRQMVQDSVSALKQAASAYQQDSLYSPVEHKGYLSAGYGSPEASERDDLALNRDVTIDRSLHAIAASDDFAAAEGDYAGAGSRVSSANYEGDYAPYTAASAYGAAPAASYQPAAGTAYGDQRYASSAQCNPCGPPPCPNPCPPPPPPPVPCVVEIPLCVQYLINIFVIFAGLAVLKWYCTAMAELDRECGLDDRAGGGQDVGLSMKKSSFSPPMATISAYYDPMTNQVLLPQHDARAAQHYQFTR